MAAQAGHPRFSGLPPAVTKKGGWVYIITNRPNGSIYIGVTADIARRIAQHKSVEGSAFTKRYGLNVLVYAERYDDIRGAIAREQIWNDLAV
jgi:putative endonuclease